MALAAAIPRRSALAGRMASQGAMLIAAFGIGQGLSLVRNALLGHSLSKGDFGTAATITLALQLVEVLSDLGVERHLVQSADGDDAKLQAAAHGLQAARGVLASLVLLVLAHPIAAFFHIADAAWAFQIAALAPLVRGFVHLDSRRLQRHYDNRSFVVTEVVPPALGTALLLPLLQVLDGYAVVSVVLVVQAVATLGLSLLLAERPYRLAFDTHRWCRILAFGWPIWLSAFPLVAVYQGERVIVGRLLGVEALAAFTVSFMATMVPGLIAAKVGHALMLPALAQSRATPRRFLRRVRLMSEATTLVASGYAMVFLIAGETLLPMLFGPAYRGLGALTACLALMWSLRMLQAVPGMTAMALGSTRPLLIAGCLRAAALPFSLVLAYHGASLPVVVAAGIAGEIVSLLYVSYAANRLFAGAGGIVLRRSLFLVPAAILSIGVARDLDGASAVTALAASTGLGAAMVMAALAVMPGVRRYIDLYRLKTMRRRRASA